MQRFKGNGGVEAAVARIAAEIVRADEREPLSRMLAGQPAQHIGRKVDARHRQAGKAFKDAVQLQARAAAQVQQRRGRRAAADEAIQR